MIYAIYLDKLRKQYDLFIPYHRHLTSQNLKHIFTIKKKFHDITMYLFFTAGQMMTKRSDQKNKQILNQFHHEKIF